MALLFHANTPAEAIEAVRQHVSDLARHYHGLAKHSRTAAANSNIVRATTLEQLAASLTDIIVLSKRARPPSPVQPEGDTNP